jgi:NAD(P)-dependent dehydrogenase (short-subunit alcohol dehydrogenase family)
MKNLTDKVILVCGGATGIGAATARRLSEEGARVAIGDINLEAAEQTASECEGAIAFHYDQADEASINALVQQTVDHYGLLNGVFANAADLQTVLIDGDILSNDIYIWERTLQVNVTGTAMVIRACIPHLLEQGGGAIVCTSSGASTIGENERPAYAASKAGVNAICRHVASRFSREGIRANSVAPGLVVTPQLAEGMGEETLAKMLRGVPSPRHGDVGDIAGSVAFLMSDDGEWVTGQTWHVNGGVYYGG